MLFTGWEIRTEIMDRKKIKRFPFPIDPPAPFTLNREFEQENEVGRGRRG
jgi:hypothetical protein